MRIEPGLPELHNNLGNALKDHGQIDRAEGWYPRAIELRPGFAAARAEAAIRAANEERDGFLKVTRVL